MRPSSTVPGPGDGVSCSPASCQLLWSCHRHHELSGECAGEAESAAQLLLPAVALFKLAVYRQKTSFPCD